MEQRNTAATPQARPIPIPRTGLRGSSGILLLLMLTLASATVGIGICAMRTTSQLEVTIAEAVSGVAAVLLSVHTWRISRRAKGVIPILALIAVFMAYLTNSLIPAGVLIALVCGIASGALSLTVISKKQLAWLPLVPLIAYGATVLCSRDPVGAVACLLPLPAAWALSFGTRRSAEKSDGLTRVGVICLTSLVLALTLAGMLSLTLYRQLGSLDIETLSGALETARESAITWITSMELPEDTPDELREFFSRESAEEMVNSIINLLPGYVIVAVNLIVAIAQLLLHAALVSFGCGESITARVRLFCMSAVSCVVFTAAYLVALLGSSEVSTLPGTVAQNIYLVLMPGLAFSGLIRLLGGLAGRRMGCLAVLAVFLAPLILLIAPLALAVVEVVGRFAAFLAARLRSPDDDDPFGKPPEDRS